MAITLGTGTSNVSGAPATTLTTSYTCSGSDKVLVVGVSLNSGTTTGVTYAGVAMTKIDAQLHTGLGDCSLWYLVNPADGANNVVSTSSVSTFHTTGIILLNGASQTGIPDATTKSNGSGSSYSNTLTTVADNCVHLAFTRSSSASVIAGASTTNLTSSGANWNLFRRNGDVTPAGSSTINVTAGSALNYAIVGASFKPSVATTTNSNFLQFF